MESAGVSLPPELLELVAVLDSNITTFARGSSDAQQLALRATKCVFEDSLHSEIKSIPHITKLFASLSPSEAPKTRGQMRKKRKRSPSPPAPIKTSLTPLQSLIVDGMDETQIWAQLDLKLQTVCDMLDLVVEVDNDMDTEEGVEQSQDMLSKSQDMLSMDDEDSLDIDDIHNSEDSSEGSEEEELGSSDSSQGEESIADLQDSSDEEDQEIPLAPMRRGPTAPGRQPSTLNDDFFDLATFNAETERAEARHASRGQLAEEDESDEDIDLFMPIDSAEDVHDESEHGTYYYDDFFSVPHAGRPSKVKNKSLGGERNGKVRFHEEVRVKKIRQRGKGLPLHALEVDDEEYADLDGDSSWLGLGEVDGEDGDEVDGQIDSEDDDSTANEIKEATQSTQEAVERLKQDLFAEEEEVPQADLSAHEKRMMALQKQIQDLESENVASKDWALMGEATSKSRPRNSLLEEDLEFDRMVKATPIITVESVKALEDRIRARILDGVFDDVVRVRPADDKPFAPSRFTELRDTKSTQSLAQIYEEDYVNQSTGNTPTSSRDAKLLKEHSEIEQVWESVCSKLDALCNAHFTPKQPKTVISTTSNTSSAVMESALPTTKSVVSALAPEEIFAASSSEPRARSEMTPSEKKSLRNKLRKSRQRSREELQKSVGKPTKAKQIKSVGKQKAAALASIVKNGKGVTVVGKKKSTTSRGRNV